MVIYLWHFKLDLIMKFVSQILGDFFHSWLGPETIDDNTPKANWS